MTLLIVLAVLLLLFVLLWFMKMGGRVEYGEEGLCVRVHLGWFYFRVYPVPERLKGLLNRPKKKKKPKKKKNPSPKPQKPKPKESRLQKLMKQGKRLASEAGDYLTGGEGGSLGVVMRALPEIFGILGETVHRLCVEEIVIHYTIPGRYDAAGAAIQYGTVYATGGVVMTFLNQYLNIKKHSVGARVDFNESEQKVWLCLDLSYRFGDLVIIAIHALKEFVILRNQINEQKKKS